MEISSYKVVSRSFLEKIHEEVSNKFYDCCAICDGEGCHPVCKECTLEE